jgi:Predicted acyl-CoA transferases/carnitine dehydratase
MTGPVGRPLRAGSSVNDIMGGMFGAIGVLAALNERNTTGVGREVQSALYENCVLLAAQHMQQYVVTGQAAAPMPNRISAWAIYDVFTFAGGEQMFVAATGEGQWHLCQLLGQTACSMTRRWRPTMTGYCSGRGCWRTWPRCSPTSMPSNWPRNWRPTASLSRRSAARKSCSTTRT